MPDRVLSACSRRSVLAALAAGGLTLTLKDLVTAQVATPDADPRAGHAIVGAWQLQLDSAPDHVSIALFNANGTYVEYDPDPIYGLGLGVWLATDHNSAQVVTNVQAPAIWYAPGKCSPSITFPRRMPSSPSW
jgi:hypothetical protein